MNRVIDIENTNQLEEVIKIAHATWPLSYGKIQSKEQTDYMLSIMYTRNALEKQFREQQHQFILIQDSNTPIGFASFQYNYPQNGITKIHKLYVLPHLQGKGHGATLIQNITQKALANQNKELTLNVNRKNPSILFYQKQGFSITKEENIDIGSGYWMIDFIMSKTITQSQASN